MTTHEVNLEVGLEIGETDRHHDDLAALPVHDDRSLGDVEVADTDDAKFVLAERETAPHLNADLVTQRWLREPQGFEHVGRVRLPLDAGFLRRLDPLGRVGS